MRKATLPWLLGFMKLTLAAILFFGSSKSSDVDFFDIVDQTTAEYLTAERRGRNLGRSGGSSAAVISPPRNNKYLEASMQIIKGKMIRLFDAHQTFKKLTQCFQSKAKIGSSYNEDGNEND